MKMVKPVVISLTNRASIAFFGFINFFVLVRILSKDDFGAWILFISITTILESIRKSFIYNPLIRYLNNAGNKNEKSVIISSSFVLNSITLGIAVSFLILSRYLLTDLWNVPELSHMMLVYTVGQLFFTFTIHYNSLNEAQLNFKGTLLSGLSQRLVFLVYLLYCYIFEYAILLEELVLVHVICMGMASLLAFLFGRRYHLLILHQALRIREQAGYGIYTFGTNISSMIFKNTDSWMLGGIIGKVAVASYNPAIRIANLFEVPLGAISSVVFPSMVSRIREKGLGEAKIMYEKTVGFLLAAMLPFIILVIGFSKSIVIFIAGHQYADSYPILQVTMLYGILVPFNRQFGITMNAIGKAKINFLVLISNASLNVLLNYILIMRYGIMGAAYATLFSYFIILVICEILLYKILNVSLFNIGNNYLKSHITLLNLIKPRVKSS